MEYGYSLEVASPLSGRPLEELREVSDLFGEDVYEALNLENCMALRNSFGGPARESVERQIALIEEFTAARG